MNIRPVKYENPMKHVYFEPHFKLFNQSLCIRTVVLKLVVLRLLSFVWPHTACDMLSATTNGKSTKLWSVLKRLTGHGFQNKMDKYTLVHPQRQLHLHPLWRSTLQIRDAQILGTRSPWCLNLVLWHPIFVSDQYGTYFMAPRILWWLLYRWKICAPLLWTPHHKT